MIALEEGRGRLEMVPPGFHLGKYDRLLKDRLLKMAAENLVDRFRAKDPGLWRGSGIANSLGWLTVAGDMKANLESLARFADEVRGEGFRYVVHVGMGGSSLAPLVFSGMFGPQHSGLEVLVLDTTHPGTIRRLGRPLEDTLFVIASKSGTTAEVAALADYFYDRVKAGKSRAGGNFVAVTDPGTPLVELAQSRSFRRTFLNPPDIGGRFSALSFFGLVPAALLNLDLATLLARATEMAEACSQPAAANPGIALGAALGELAGHGIDKLTFIMPDSLALFGMWLEQLIAESTGKEGRGLLPVAGEALGDPTVYADDRLFVYFRMAGQEASALEKAVAALRDGGRPVVVIEMRDRLDLGREFFRWEVAVSVAGAVLGINPFDQPNVQESKDNTNRLLKVFQSEGRLPEGEPSVGDDDLTIYSSTFPPTVEKSLEAFCAQCRPGDYFSLLAYLSETRETEEKLQSIRRKLRDKFRVATTLGYGPRYLHSTGQYHKGGPNNGLFIQITGESPADETIPGRAYTFGVFNRAQALGDFSALEKHGRRVMRIHLKEVPRGLDRLERAVDPLLP